MLEADDLFNNIIPNEFEKMNEEVDALHKAYEAAKRRYEEKIKEIEKSNKEAAQVTVPRCVRCSLVASKQVHAADFDANFAGRILLLPGRKTRLRRRRHKRNMTNS